MSLKSTRTVQWHICKLVIELARVHAPINCRSPRRRHIPRHQLIPIQLRKEVRGLDIFRVIRAGTESPPRILRQQSPQYLHGPWRQVLGILQRAPAYLLEQLLAIAAVEGRQSREHLVQ